ncbi:beta-ketoacyl-[acyl-carrier-protein] synthase family protein [Candidatus Woesearchaeota archaeon]|nr:beta-ketoacyl-[acyl-carrier-protein] synthase family protein [Candidatus Woesearchaeota archaeon]
MNIKINDRDKKRVVITGIGPITSTGIGKEEFWHNSLEGKSGTEKIPFEWFTKNPDRFRSHVCATVKNFDPTKYGLKNNSKRLDRVSLFALASTYLALQDAGIDFTASKGKAEIKNLDLDQGCVLVSTGIGGFNTVTEEHEHYTLEQKVNPFAVSKSMPNAPSDNISIIYGIKGESWPTPTACAAGTMALGNIYRLIALGEYKWGIAGGIESCFGHDGYGFYGFDTINMNGNRTLSTAFNNCPEKASRSFDKNRDGFVLAEGGASLFIEELEHALARNAHIYAEIIAYAANSDARNIMALDPEANQLIKLINNLLKKSRLNPEDIQYINAHATSTPPNDRVETMAIKKVLGEHAYRIIVGGTKSRTGHSIGGSGATEIAETALAIYYRIIPPTINFEEKDPDCDLNYSHNRKTEIPVNLAMKLTSGFGGHNAGLILSKYKE